MPVTRRRTVLGVMCAGMFLVLLDVSAVQVALPAIGSSLGASLAGLQWVVDGYAVTLAALLLPSGALADRWGHRRMVLAGFSVFGLASLGCGLAPSTGVLVAMRAVQGVGAAVLLPATMAVISGAFPGRREQARALGLWAGISSLALPAGPVVGGLLVTVASWRAVFLVNLPVVLVAGLLTYRVVHGFGTRGAARRRRLDLSGALSVAIGLAAMVHAVISAGQGGRGPDVVVGAVVAAVAGAVFVRAESRAADPLLPLGLLRRSRFLGPNAVAASMNLVGVGLIFAVTLYLQQLQHRSALWSGFALVPLFLPLAGLSPFTGRLTARVGPRVPMLLGLLVGALGGAGLLLLRADSGYAALLPALLGLGTGMGLLTSAVVTAAMRALPPEHAGLAGGANNTARQAGGALGVAAFGAVLGSPARPDRFVAHLHLLGMACAALWLLAAAITVLTVRPREQAATSAGERLPAVR